MTIPHLGPHGQDQMCNKRLNIQKIFSPPTQVKKTEMRSYGAPETLYRNSENDP